MAEYYSVLSRAVATLETNTPETRRAVYDKARNALIGQLKAIVPPLPTSEISRQRLELEEAIRRAEREAANAAAAPPPRAAARPMPSPPPEPPPALEEVDAEPEAEEVVASSPQDVFRRAIREAETRGSTPPPTMERAPASARSDAALGNMGADFHVGDRPRRSRPAEELPPYVPATGYRNSDRGGEPRLAPDYDWEASQVEPEPVSSRYSQEPYVDGRDRPSVAAARRRNGGGNRENREFESAEADYGEANVRPSRLPTIVLLVLIVAMAGGLAALAWSQRGMISDILASVEDKGSESASAPPTVDQAPAAPAVQPQATADASGKDSDSLLGSNGGADTSTNVRVVDPSGAPTAAAEAPAAAPGGVLVAQKAVLYEEPVDSTKGAGVTQINAAVTWNYVEGGADGPSVVANLDVPERGLKIKLTIRKNTDKTLPASHLIEVVTDAQANFPGKGINGVPRLVMKPGEDARGQPLIGASAKVADGFFWIALSALDTDVKANLQLLKERDWIDLPLVYGSGQRAILTFEKGTPGERALDQAIAAWSAG